MTPKNPGALAVISPAETTYTTRERETVTGSGSKTLVYDANGNLTSDGTRTFEWDPLNRLTAVTLGAYRSEFTYNGLSQRIKIVEKDNGNVASTKQFIWVTGDTQPCEERDASNNVTKRYYPQGMQVGTTNYYYTKDHLGSIRELTDSSGAMQTRYDYDPYGRRTKLSGSVDTDFGFTGHYYHQPSGLHLAVYRAYDADLGRWISRDPVGERGGIDLYTYASNNPVNLVDPLGLRPLTDCEKEALAPYIPKEDLDNPDLHDGQVPFWLGKNFAGVTIHNNIYFRSGVYDSSTVNGLAILGHELVDVGQYGAGMSVLDYIWASRRGYENNPYEIAAYKKEAEIKASLPKDKCCQDKCCQN